MKSLNYHQIKEQILSAKQPSLEISILLDRPNSDMNIAHVFRLADAASIKHIYILSQNPQIKWKKVEQLSRKNTSCVPYSMISNIDQVEKHDHFIALEWTDKSTSIFDLERINGTVLMVVGNEQTGVTQNLLNHCHSSIHLPMYGQHSSINMAMATSVAIYHLLNLSVKK